MGADVIKIEDPARPPTPPCARGGQGERDGHRFFWTVHARNKRCVTLDLRSPAGQDLFRRLVAESDVIVENFRPGTLEKWGLGYDVLSEINRGSCWPVCPVTGRPVPRRGQAGYASVAEAESGLRHLNGYPGAGPPPRLALSLGGFPRRDVCGPGHPRGARLPRTHRTGGRSSTWRSPSPAWPSRNR